ncbi:hypothetical protein [Alistipes sp. An66]|uniref:hypothetical protein n=1 Tax=Alistipes sp. An66 TaxID=1965650 RepID=UPI001177E7CB|nr:hypothetical protein [Alistipes sp. An66]
MPDWMFGVISGVGSLILLVITIAVGLRFERKMQKERRERRRQALEDYFEAKERYEKRKNS